MQGRLIELRPPDDEDFARISSWISSDSPGAAYTGDVAEDVSPERIRQIHASGSARYLMIHTATQGAVGAVNWGRRGHSRSYAVAVIIGRNELWQAGYGAEAFLRLLDHLFQTLDAWRVEAVTASFNPYTISAFTRQRLTIEGVLRDYFYVDGEYHDATVWSVLRPEYLEGLARHEAAGFLPYEPLVPVADKDRAKAELRRYLAGTPNASWTV